VATHAASRLARSARLRGIYVVLDENDRVLELARAALGAGVGLLQYRAKASIVAQNVRRLREMTRDAGALLFVNDDWRAALEFDCDGVHLGPGDEGFDDIARVRDALGERLIGVSCGTAGELERARGADYAGVGSVYATGSKADAGDPIGIEGLRTLASVTALPVAAIGGITLERLPAIRAAGAAMAAVISALAHAPDPQRAARELVSQWNA
jgi:thiamine-phosphate pyrophosphorylase